MRVTLESPQDSQAAKLTRKIPLIGRLANHPKANPLPVPILHPDPTAIPGETLTKARDVLIAVKVDRTGKIAKAELFAEDLAVQGNLAWTALRAAKQWTFQPARGERGPVESDVLLHYRFEPVPLN